MSGILSSNLFLQQSSKTDSNSHSHAAQTHMFHYNSNSTQKQFKFKNDVLCVPLFFILH